MDWEIRLITLFIYVSMQYNTHLWVYCQRYGNNNRPEFTDEEVITIFLFGIMQNHFEITDIYNYTRDHLSEWFPKLPSYAAFIQRLNRFESLFPALTEHILSNFAGRDMIQRLRLIDSFPIIIANEKRSSGAKVAEGFANKGYCASKNIWYYGVKVHISGIGRHKTLPLPEYIGVTPASDHDLTAFRRITEQLENCELFADMAYIDTLEKQILKEQGAELHTPVKKKKGQKRLELFDRILSTEVSRVRQPIESLFNWLQEKTKIQHGSKIRSYNGLMVHIFGRLTAAMFLMVFNS
ncbi:MAG: IS982 family transposase [Desulfobacteraceae bacterium]|nr:IS982 family transposase [Desulfobacteraceae bacterium]